MKKRKIKAVIILLILIVLTILPSKVFAIPASVEDQRKAVISVAEAFKRKSNKVQYCSYRKNLFATPEDATEQTTVFTVCSGLTFQSYYQALGIEIPSTTGDLLDYASINRNKTDNIIFFYDNEGDSDIKVSTVLPSKEDADRETFVSNIIDKVLPGDVFVYTGHATLVKEVNKATNTITLIESSSYGIKFDPEDRHEFYNENGTVGEVSLKKTIKNPMQRMALIRFITDGTSFLKPVNNNKEEGEIVSQEGITEASFARFEFPDIDIEKTVKINGKYGNNFANPGDILSFKIEITNNSSKKYSNMKISENIDSNFNFISSSGGVYENNILEWENVTVNAKESKILNYQVKLSDDDRLLGEIILSTGNVSGINSGRIEIKVGASFDNDQIDKIKNSFNNLKTNTVNERNFINEVYLNALGVNLGISGLTNFDIISYDSEIPFGGSEELAPELRDKLSVKFTKVNPNFSNLILNNYYGLKLATATNPVKQEVRSISNWNVYVKKYLIDRAREITYKNLEEGDVILTYQGKESYTDSNFINKSYIYLDGSLYRKLGNNTIEQLSNDGLEDFLKNLVVENYVVLRPALIYGNVKGDTILPENCTITYKLSGGTYNGKTDDIIREVTYNTKPEDITPTREHYIFNGWDKEIVAATEDTTYTAQWKPVTYTYTFKLDGGNIDGDIDDISLSGEYNTDSSTPKIPTRKHYTFTGWSSTVSSTYEGNNTYTAQWKPVDYTITYKLSGGTYNGKTDDVISEVTYNTKPEDITPTRENYTFNGWDKEIVVATEDATYTAQWTLADYTVTHTFKLDGGNIDGDADNIIFKGTYNTDSSTPKIPTRKHYTFTGWYPTVPSTYEGNNTYTAQWKPVDYTITYKLSGGTYNEKTGNITNEVTYNTKPEDITPTREHYTFNGWDKEIGVATEDTTYTAQWKPVTYTYTFKLDAGNIDGATNDVSLSGKYNTNSSIPTNPTKEHYTFTGWYPTVPSTYEGNNTYIAQWKPVDGEKPKPDDTNTDKPVDVEKPKPDDTNTNKPVDEEKLKPTYKDETTVPLKKLPNSGKKITVLVLIVVFGIVAIISYKKKESYNF